MKIAVNIADLTRYGPIPLQCLVTPVIRDKQTANIDAARLDEIAVVLECDETRARAIVNVLRTYDTKAKRYPARAYQQGPRGGWSKLED